jgi:hypothetical protein
MGRKKENGYSLAGTERSRSAAHLITKQQLYTVSRELDDTTQLLQEQQNYFQKLIKFYAICEVRMSPTKF